MTDTALIIFTDSRGLVLLQQKTYDAPNFPGIWSLFGGATEEGETAEDALRREVREELTIELSEFAPLFFRSFLSHDRNRSVFVVNLSDDVKLHLQEGRGLGYFTEEEIRTLSMPDHIREILTAYFLYRR